MQRQVVPLLRAVQHPQGHPVRQGLQGFQVRQYRPESRQVQRQSYCQSAQEVHHFQHCQIRDQRQGTVLALLQQPLLQQPLLQQSLLQQSLLQQSLLRRSLLRRESLRQSQDPDLPCHQDRSQRLLLTHRRPQYPEVIRHHLQLCPPQVPVRDRQGPNPGPARVQSF